MKLIAAVALGLAVQVTSAGAFVCHGRLSLTPDETIENLFGDEGSIECLVDNILSRELAAFELRANDIVSTEMTSANLGASGGRPQIAYHLNYTIWAEKFDLLAKLWAEKRSNFTELASSVAREVTSSVCANGTGEAAYFAAGGTTKITISLMCIDGFTRSFHEELVSFEINACEAP